jgi:putative transposase
MHIRKIGGWSMPQALHTEIAFDAVNMAVERQRPPN